LLRTFVLGVLAAWVLQLSIVFYYLVNLTWQNYWFCRGLYRPGLILFAWLFKGVLPGYFFSAFNRIGVITGFAFATLFYALVLVSICMLFQQITARGRTAGLRMRPTRR
jgi:Na+-transporting NADH:ubiquinone oxidoreductase subunit NqrB